ncbi:uncharacterized mitochondrial protein-like protein [Tanacetum coccineum]
MDLQDKGVTDSGCSRHMTGNMSCIIDFEEIDGGYVAFGGNPKGGKITCRVPRKNNMYSVDLKNIVPKGGLTCLFTKATFDESKLWYRRLEHINFKTMNKLVKGNLEVDQIGFLILIFALMKSMNYKPVVVGNQSNGNAGIKACEDNSSKSSSDAGFKPLGDNEKKVTEEPGKEGGDPSKEGECNDQDKEDNVNCATILMLLALNGFMLLMKKHALTSLDPNMPLIEYYSYLKMMKMLVQGYQVNPKVSHLHAVKKIFRYLKGQPKLGLWYLKDSPFDLVAYTDSDYVGASLDRKSTTGGCQFLRSRLISWQCKKQTVVANSTVEAEYVAASSCYGQVH